VPFKRLLIAVTVACLLLLTQQAGAVHALSHLGAEPATSQQDQDVSLDRLCEQCLAFAVLAAGAPPSANGVALAAPPGCPACAQPPSTTGFAKTPYWSRGPPLVF
jgi:hypothetical protein